MPSWRARRVWQAWGSSNEHRNQNPEGLRLESWKIREVERLFLILVMRSKTFKLCIPQVSSQAFRFCKYFFLCGLKKHLCVRSNWWKAIIKGEESKEVLPRSMRKQHKFSSFNFFFTFPKCCQDATSSGNKCLPDVALGCYAATPTISFVTCLCNPRSRLPLSLPFCGEIYFCPVAVAAEWLCSCSSTQPPMQGTFIGSCESH